jgi:hypothetical protein
MKFFEGLMKYFAGKKATERTALSISNLPVVGRSPMFHLVIGSR